MNKKILPQGGGLHHLPSGMSLSRGQLGQESDLYRNNTAERELFQCQSYQQEHEQLLEQN